MVAGEAHDSFLLTNVQLDGTPAAPAHALYRFNTTKGLKEYVGRRVKVTGTADRNDLDKGKVGVRTEGDRAIAEITSERRTVKVEEPWFGSIGAITLDADVPTYKFEVENVMPLAGNCTAAGAGQ